MLDIDRETMENLNELLNLEYKIDEPMLDHLLELGLNDEILLLVVNKLIRDVERDIDNYSPQHKENKIYHSVFVDFMELLKISTSKYGHAETADAFRWECIQAVKNVTCAIAGFGFSEYKDFVSNKKPGKYAIVECEDDEDDPTS